MPYSAEISRANPTCFIFIIDQSGSMGDSFGLEAGTGSKADFVADVVNRTLHGLVIRCTKTEEIRSYYHLSIIGYGGSVQSALSGSLGTKQMVPISEVAENPARLEIRTKKVPDGAGGLVEQQVRFPIWVDPRSDGGTPMCEALRQAKRLIEQWVSEHRNGFPPTVLHLTDGESTDGDPTSLGKEVLSLSTSDGPVLVFNCHVSSRAALKLEYPGDNVTLPDDFARTLFNISSVLPDGFKKAADQIGVRVSEGSRGFVFNGDPASVVQFFEIGTRPANLR
jgi:hypothetical protein